MSHSGAAAVTHSGSLPSSSTTLALRLQVFPRLGNEAKRKRGDEVEDEVRMGFLYLAPLGALPFAF